MPRRAHESPREAGRAQEGPRKPRCPGEPRRAQEGPGGPRCPGGPREPRRTHESPGGPRRAQETTGGPRRAPESAGEPLSTQDGKRGGGNHYIYGYPLSYQTFPQSPTPMRTRTAEDTPPDPTSPFPIGARRPARAYPTCWVLVNNLAWLAQPGPVGPAARLARLAPRGPSQGSSRGSLGEIPPGGPPGEPPGNSTPDTHKPAALYEFVL